MKSIVRVGLMVVILATPLLASAACFPDNFGGQNCTTTWMSGGSSDGVGVESVAGKILYIINVVLVPTLFAIAFIVFLYGVAKTYIFSHGESEAVEEGHKLILWGIIGFVVMVSLWGLVNVVANTFGLQGYGAPTPPNSYYQ